MTLLMKKVTAAVLLFAAISLARAAAQGGPEETAHRIADPEIRAGVEAAVVENLLPAATGKDYTGCFNISAGGEDPAPGTSRPTDPSLLL
jgi:hypothetical protein